MDRRTVRTQMAVKKALLNLMTKKPFDKITVKEICEKADIGNRTFYLHFLDKYDVIDKLIDFHMGKLESICNIKTSSEVSMAPEKWLSYMYENITFFQLMFNEESHFAFQYQFLKLIKKMCQKITFDNKMTRLENNLTLQFIVHGIYGITESFIKQPSLDDIALYSKQINRLTNQIAGNII